MTVDSRFKQKIVWTCFFLFFPRECIIGIMILRLEWKIGKFENVRIFKHYLILIMSSKKERIQFDLKETENIKSAKRKLNSMAP